MCSHIRVHTNTQVVIENVDSAGAVCLPFTRFLANWVNQKW